MASTLRKFITWFRDSQTPRRGRRDEKDVRTVQRAERARLAQPHYYVIGYRKEQIRGGRVLPESESGWAWPKEYFGPLGTKAEAEATLRAELSRYGLPRRQYKIQRLTADQFEQVWGSPPGTIESRGNWEEGV